jgi:hypothetical protein
VMVIFVAGFIQMMLQRPLRFPPALPAGPDLLRGRQRSMRMRVHPIPYSFYRSDGHRLTGPALQKDQSQERDRRVDSGHRTAPVCSSERFRLSEGRNDHRPGPLWHSRASACTQGRNPPISTRSDGVTVNSIHCNPPVRDTAR